MPREQHAAEEIRAELARLLGADPARLPLPERLTLPSDPFDDSGANWHIPAWPNIWPNTSAVRKAILDVKARRDLRWGIAQHFAPAQVWGDDPPNHLQNPAVRRPLPGEHARVLTVAPPTRTTPAPN